MWLILAESDILPNRADGLGSDVEERGYVLQGKVLHDAGTTLQQLLIALAGCGAVEVEITRTELEENVLGNDGTQLHRLDHEFYEFTRIISTPPRKRSHS